MTFKQKFTWVSLIAAVAVACTYCAVVGTKLGTVPVARIAYQLPMGIAIGVFIVLTIVGTILMGIGTGIAMEITGEGDTKDIGLDDERDDDIDQRGRNTSAWVAAVGSGIALVLAMVRADQFWIANAIYLAFVASTIAAAAHKLVIYRRGF